MCESIDFVEIDIIYNDVTLGVTENPKALLNHIFNTSDFNVYLEEDIVVSPDVLLMANWYADHQKYEDYPILCLSNFDTVDYTKEPNIISSAHPLKFTPFAWATDKKYWETHMSKTWSTHSSGWDFAATKELLDAGLTIAHPNCSRSNHIGVSGVHMTADYYNKTYVNKSYYQGTPIKDYEFYHES